MSCLSLFDIAGIQNFVFASKKARENVGASVLVSHVFEDFLMQIIRDNCPDALIDWENAKEFKMLLRPGLSAEVIYVGGGNALVAFKDKDTAVRVTKKFSRRVLEGTEGVLGVAAAHYTITSNFADDMRNLRQALEQNKFSLPNAQPLLGLAVIREGETDGLPANGRGRGVGQWLSSSALKKREAAEETGFNMLAPEGFFFPVEFDQLGRDKDAGESLLAIVHIDGNSMGKTIANYVDGAGNDYGKAVTRIRDISKAISYVYKEAFQDMTSDLAHVFQKEYNSEFCRKFGVNITNAHKGTPLPLRPLIFAGDDVTFVCDGRIALDLAANFMCHVSKCKNKLSKEVAFSACAGIAVVKPHFPFYRAYELAEELCSSAKKMAKKSENLPVGSWIDFQIVYSGLPTDLDGYRTSKYSVPGQNPKEGFPLLWRPYCVDAAKPDKSRLWSDVVAYLNSLTGSDENQRGWPRSKLKGLREAFCVSMEEAQNYYVECQSRGYMLPGNGNLFENDRTRWFDIIELMDAYVNIPWDKGGEDR